jgi:hypothetical protein
MVEIGRGYFWILRILGYSVSRKCGGGIIEKGIDTCL